MQFFKNGNTVQSFISVCFLFFATHTAAQGCTPSRQWTAMKQHSDIKLTKGCLTDVDYSGEYLAAAIPASRYRFSLVGSSGNNSIPSRKEVRELKSRKDLRRFSQSEVHKRNPDSIILAPIGTPDWSPTVEFRRLTFAWIRRNFSKKWLVPSGFLRMSGVDIAETDDLSTYKSAYVCLNESKFNSGKGSRIIIFNAFEDGFPVEMNPRLRDLKSCLDVAQTGPRVIEYSRKPGINRPNGRQRYLLLAVGAGRDKYQGPEECLVYLILFTTPVDFFDVQNQLLEKGKFSPFDDKMKVAVVLTTHNFSNISNINRNNLVELWLPLSRPHPVYLSVSKTK